MFPVIQPYTKTIKAIIANIINDKLILYNKDIENEIINTQVKKYPIISNINVFLEIILLFLEN